MSSIKGGQCHGAPGDLPPLEIAAVIVKRPAAPGRSAVARRALPPVPSMASMDTWKLQFKSITPSVFCYETA